MVYGLGTSRATLSLWLKLPPWFLLIFPMASNGGSVANGRIAPAIPALAGAIKGKKKGRRELALFLGGDIPCRKDRSRSGAADERRAGSRPPHSTISGNCNRNTHRPGRHRDHAPLHLQPRDRLEGVIRGQAQPETRCLPWRLELLSSAPITASLYRLFMRWP